MSTILVQLGNAKLRIPVFRDEVTTRTLAQQVSERLKKIEGESERIDTQAFALRAAFEFAAEVHELRVAREQDQRDMGVCLDRIL
ncbi:MAG: cell division protein ZapA, partial [Candidatus Hydrogenedentes bacterium]|nr:cell division protein ZapA [Candidatus Hydrogenedentota bacterium]